MLDIDLENYKDLKVISFDIFDTAIIRDTFRPKDLFDIVENKYGNNFKELRMQAEKLSREKNGGECSLNDIYKTLVDIVPAFKEIYEEIKAYEVELELKYTRPHKEILDFYNSIKNKYKIIFISDMYLSTDILTSMLKNAGYESHPVYVSGEVGINKGKGGLFDYVLEDLNVKSQEMLHIGDNYHSDVVSANKKGIHTYYFLNNYDKSHFSKNIKTKQIIDIYNHSDYSTSFLTKLLTEKENSNANIYNKIGFYWGIIFYNFTKWVIDSADGRRILFNSRDGYLPHKIAKCIMGINCDYIFISRRSSALIAFDTNYPINHEKNLYFYDAFRFQRVNTLQQLLGCIGFDSKKVIEKIKKSGFKSDQDNIEPFQHNKEETHQKIENLLLSIEPEIYDHCAPMKRNLLNYVDRLNISNNDVFCDIGYNGSIQYGIELLKDVKLDGKYFEVYKRKIVLDCNKEGYLSTGENLTYGYGGLLETLFSAPHGGVIGYDSCEPILFNDSKQRINILNKIHDGIIEFCIKWHELQKKSKEIDLLINKEIIKKMVMRFLKEPSLEEAKYGLEIPFDNGAEDALENITWFNEERIKQGRIIECYNRSYWKEAFLNILNNSEYANLGQFLQK